MLIHAGSGGVGQAAISIALAASCTVYTTVSTQQKKAVLQKRFPQVCCQGFYMKVIITFRFFFGCGSVHGILYFLYCFP